MSDLRVAVLAAPTANNERNSFTYTLKLAADWLGHPWAIAKPSEANFIFMLVNSIKNLKTLQNLQQNYPPDKLIVASSVGVELPQVRWHLPFSKQLPFPSTLSVVNLFSRIQETLTEISPSQAGGISEPNNHLPGVIEQCSADGIARMCSLGNSPTIVIAPKEKSFYLAETIEAIIPLALAAKKELTIKEIDNTELKKHVDTLNFGTRVSDYATFDDVGILPQIGMKSPPKQRLTELVWFSVLVGSRGNPLSSYSLTDKVSLHEIPDVLLKDYYAQEYKRLAENLFAKPTPILEAAQKSGRSLFDTINFCNACAVLRIADFSSEEDLNRS